MSYFFDPIRADRLKKEASVYNGTINLGEPIREEDENNHTRRDTYVEYDQDFFKGKEAVRG